MRKCNCIILLNILLFLFTIISFNSRASDRYTNAFDAICTSLKIEREKIILIRSSGGIAECQNFKDKTAHIYYNQTEFDKFPINYFIGAMCHELGHFTNQDSTGCNIKAEGEADLAAGRSMRMLGFDINSTQFFLKVYKNASSRCYPNQREREEYVRKGWYDLDKEIIEKNGYNLLVPKVTWSTSNDYRLEVHIGERILTFSNWNNKGNVVIVYDSLTTTTVQLLDYKSKKNEKGLGRVVTSQGLYCYFLYPKKNSTERCNYQIYYKGKLLSLEDCDPNNKKENEDLIVRCRDKNNGNTEVGFKLIDYYLAPYNYVLPAVYQ